MSHGRGEKVSAFVPQILYPFPKRAFQQFLASSKDLLVIELSYTAQFYKYLRTFLNLPDGRTHVYKRSGGKDLAASEVMREIRKVRAASAGRQVEVIV